MCTFNQKEWRSLEKMVMEMEIASVWFFQMVLRNNKEKFFIHPLGAGWGGGVFVAELKV